MLSPIGQTVFESTDLNPEMSINLNNQLKSGVYFVRVENNSGQAAVRKLTIVK